MAEENDKGNRQEPQPVKKLPYVPPKLTELGTLQDITRATSSMGSSDNGTRAGANKTSV